VGLVVREFPEATLHRFGEVRADMEERAILSENWPGVTREWSGVDKYSKRSREFICNVTGKC